MMTQLSRVDPKSMCHLRSTPSLVSAVREEVEEWDVAVVATTEEGSLGSRNWPRGIWLLLEKLASCSLGFQAMPSLLVLSLSFIYCKIDVKK